MSPDPFFQVVPHSIGQLESLSIQGTSWNMEDITAHLSHPAPLLEDLSVDGSLECNGRPELVPTLFNGDLSPLCRLYLEHVLTELPWRNMVNLTTFTLVDTPTSVRQLLNFFESAPNLCGVELQDIFPTPGAENGWLVSLACLKRMVVHGGPCSFLFDHLLIPAVEQTRGQC